MRCDGEEPKRNCSCFLCNTESLSGVWTKRLKFSNKRVIKAFYFASSSSIICNTENQIGTKLKPWGTELENWATTF